MIFKNPLLLLLLCFYFIFICLFFSQCMQKVYIYFKFVCLFTNFVARVDHDVDSNNVNV